MKRYTPNPTIRVLLLGAEGVGKNCIESQFTTKLFPPPYNPALTLNSRRFLTLAPLLDNSQFDQDHAQHGAKDERKAVEKKQATTALTGDKMLAASISKRPPTSRSSSTVSAASATSVHDTPSLDMDERSLVNSEGGCSECVRENNTYLVEVINYPALHKNARVRKQVHAKADYDAIILVYDVCNRASFDIVKTLHAEIPMCTRQNHHHRRHRKAEHYASTTRSRITGWFGGGRNNLTGSTGSDEVVVGLVGNKSDVAYEGPFETESGPGPATNKQGKEDTEEILRQSLLSPLYHESIMYMELMAGLERRQAAAPPDSPKVPDRQQLDNASKENDVQKWLQISRLGPTPELVGNEESEIAGSRLQLPENIPSATVRRSREVALSDGAALAHQLRLTVPFKETSARSGENIEQVFESVVREVLREMGRDASGINKTSKTCRHKANLIKLKSTESQASARRHCGLDLEREMKEHPEAQAQAQAQARMPAVSKSTGVTISTDDEYHVHRPASAAMFGEADKDVPRSSISFKSRVGWMRKMFMRNGTNIAV